MKRFLLVFVMLVTAGLVFGSDSVLFQSAENRFRSGDYQLAIEFYDELVTDYPFSRFIPDARFKKGEALYRQGKLDEALVELRIVEQRYQSSRYVPYVPFWTGMILFKNENYEAAVDDFDRYLARTDLDESLYSQALLYKSRSLINLDRSEEAVESLKMYLLGLDSPDSYAYSLLFTLLMKDQAYEEVLAYYDGLVLDEISLAWKNRLMLFAEEASWLTGDIERSRQFCEVLKQADADISSIAYQRLFQMAQLESDEETMARVVAEAERSLSGLPSILIEFWLRIGVESFKGNERALAESYLQRIWSLRYTEEIKGIAAAYLAQIQFDLGSKERAVDILEEFLTFGRQDIDLVLLKLGIFQFDLGNWSRSAEVLEQMMEDYPDSIYYSEAGYYLSFSLYKNGELLSSLQKTEELLTQATAGEYQTALLRIKSVSQINTNQREEALNTLREYLSLNRMDSAATIDKAKILFSLNRYQAVLDECMVLLEMQPELETNSPEDFIMAQYLLGASYISKKDYQNAYISLKDLSENAVMDAGLDEIYPYILYYRGWSLYQLSSGNYADAVDQFSQINEDYPGHDLEARSSYLAGWCMYADQNFSEAENYFTQVANSSMDQDLSDRSIILLGKSLSAQGRFQESAITFQNYYLQKPDGTYADDALSEHAEVLNQLGLVDESVDAFYKLFEEYPTSPFAEDGLYRRAEIFFEADRNEEASEAFYQFRLHYPDGDLVGAALYWGGMASFKNDQELSALLLWDKLITGYRTSTFRSDVMLRSAQIYEARGQYRDALNLYAEIVAYYPDLAAINDLVQKTEELRYILLGLGEQEAALSAVISSEGRTQTAAGREALLDLSRIYISENGSKKNLAVSMLEELVNVSEIDPERASSSAFLLGEYYYTMGELRTSAENYIVAAGLTEERDVAAASLFKAAEISMAMENDNEARDLVERLQTDYPSSPWTIEGTALMEDLQ